jgi:hypothetical protein
MKANNPTAQIGNWKLAIGNSPASSGAEIAPVNKETDS